MVLRMDERVVPPNRKIRESGMPPEEVWSSFFDVEEILRRMQIDSQLVNVADFACGYGTFTIPAAQRIAGIMYAVDIDPKMTRTLEDRARRLKLTYVRPVIRDLLREGSGLEDRSVDYVMLFNILHSEQPSILLREAFRVLNRGGKVGIIHWIRHPDTPRGPPIDMRPTVEQCIKWCLRSGFVAGSEISMDLKPYHFGVVIRK
jgi:ubiquinone/menaquinone biosynthesis C-methylase UbiE